MRTILIVLILVVYNRSILTREDHYAAYLEGNRLYREEDSAGAIAAFRNAVELVPDFRQAWTNLGHVLLKVGDIEDAIAAHQAAYDLDNHNVKTMYNLAVAYHRGSHLLEAISHYQEVLLLEDKHVNAIYNMGLALHDLGRIQEAAKKYREVIDIEPNHVEARLNYCNILYAADQLSLAEQCYHDVLIYNPQYVRGIVNLASFYSATAEAPINGVDIEMIQSDEDQCSIRERKAYELYQRALAIDPSDVMAMHAVTSLVHCDNNLGKQGKTVEDFSMSREYVAELFDSYAFHFEQSLLKLQYQSHILLADAIKKNIDKVITNAEQTETTLLEGDGGYISKDMNVVDLGAGTGLACLLLRQYLEEYSPSNVIVNITAVDLSQKMLLKAADKNCYDHIYVEDIIAFLSSSSTSEGGHPHLYDIAMAADVFMYFGNLEEVLRSCFRAIRRGGLLIFTVEDLEGNQGMRNSNNATYKLQRSGRFAHSRDYIIRVATKQPHFEFALLSIDAAIPRYDKGSPVHGYTVALQKPETENILKLN